jgi:hypothetical protein
MFDVDISGLVRLIPEIHRANLRRYTSGSAGKWRNMVTSSAQRHRFH